ncbi:hypothetical protein M758_5G128800 [Ceratodon purpureus]|nr:hypothetical protein M758_5G128800 [Ceratodon purpureus]
MSDSPRQLTMCTNMICRQITCRRLLMAIIHLCWLWPAEVYDCQEESHESDLVTCKLGLWSLIPLLNIQRPQSNERLFSAVPGANINICFLQKTILHRKPK